MTERRRLPPRSRRQLSTFNIQPSTNVSWNPITTANIRLQPAEIATMNNISGSTAVCAEILQTVIGEFVEAVQQGGNQFAQDGTVPDVVRPHVVNRTRWLWLCEFPQLKIYQTAERKALNDAAEKFRDQVASGTPKIAPPNYPVATGVSLVTQPLIGPGKLREFRAREEDGI